MKRRYRIVYNSSSLVGHIAAVESGLAIAVLTRCSMPAHLVLLQRKHGLPELSTLEVALLRSKASKGSGAVDAMHEQVLRTLRRAA